jgi:hypothetical protein
VYEFKNWEGEELLSNGDCKVIITLKDLTAAKIVKVKGIAKMVGEFGVMWLENLEGYKHVLLNVSGQNIPAKIKKYTSDGKTNYTLEDI